MRAGENEITRAVCRRCGSAATHGVMIGMPSPDFAQEVGATPWLRLGGCVIGPDTWTAECLTCGQREWIDGGEPTFDQSPAPDTTVARAVTAYADRCREELDQAEAPVVSHAGLWLLLASFAEHVTGEAGERLGHILGVSPGEASAAARRLLAEPHPTLATAIGAWAAGGTGTPLQADGPIPDQVALDAWAAEKTRGLIDRFPVQVDSETLVLLASALVLEPRWTESLTEDDGKLILRGGLQTIVETDAAGLVAVAKPFSEDAVDVLSVIAAPGVPPSQVWKAVDEVAAMLSDGALWRDELPDSAMPDGHSWHTRTETTLMVTSEAATLPMGPNGRRQQWRTWLRPWSASATVDLETAPGVDEVSRALLPEYENPDIGCKQTVRAEYDEDGFRAAAVTAMFAAGSAPEFVEIEVDHVEVDMTGPHAVVAIARGGAWESVPLVSAWVSEELGTASRDTDWESLALLADIDADEAAELRAYKQARMRERGEESSP